MNEDWMNYAQAPPQNMDLGQLLGSLVMQQAPQQAPAPTPQPMPMPNVSVQSQDFGNAPQISGGVSVPGFGGEVGVQGRYFRPDQQSPPDWSAMLNYRRRF